MAEKIWKEVNKDLSKFYRNVDAKLADAFIKLNIKMDNEILVDNILAFIKLIQK